MKVSIVRGGGIAGLVTTTTVDSASLAPQQVAELRSRVNQRSDHRAQALAPRTVRVHVGDERREQV
ncbi:protealysin inhibitor emfourin, partial [Streptosporangium sp. NPDC005286]|uniref:protealysin inhibitor emfourin n=1 Tax=Streptosporangium sp. NPDC005286 TaxID=3154463 RepID=UPI0033AD6669